MLSKHMEFLEEKQKTVERITQKLEERFSLSRNVYTLYEFKVAHIDAIMQAKVTHKAFTLTVSYKNNMSVTSKRIGYGKKIEALKLAEKSIMNLIRRSETIKNIYETMGYFGEYEVSSSEIQKQCVYFGHERTIYVYFLNENSPVNFGMGWNLNYYSFELKDFLTIDSKEKAIDFLEKNKRT